MSRIMDRNIPRSLLWSDSLNKVHLNVFLAGVKIILAIKVHSMSHGGDCSISVTGYHSVRVCNERKLGVK